MKSFSDNKGTGNLILYWSNKNKMQLSKKKAYTDCKFNFIQKLSFYVKIKLEIVWLRVFASEEPLKFDQVLKWLITHFKKNMEMCLNQ